MAYAIKNMFDKQFEDVAIDTALCQRIINYSIKYMNRNNDHSAFFGGVLMGVTPVLFLESDRQTWYQDVLMIDEDMMIHEFRKIKEINHSFKVSGDPFNYTPVYICHRIRNAKGIPDNVKHEAMAHAYMVLHYRFITSLFSRRFQHLANPGVAKATYAALNRRFDLKRYGSWKALLWARSEDMIDRGNIFSNTITTMQDDKMVIRSVTDLQGRIRELVKTIYAIHIDFSEQGVRHDSTSETMLSAEGEIILKDKQNDNAAYVRYIRDIVHSPTNFIRKELVRVIESCMPAAPPELIVESLKYMSDNYDRPHAKYIDEIISESLLFTFNYMHNNRDTLGPIRDLSTIIAKVRGLITAPRASDPVILDLRTRTEKMVKQATQSKYPATVAATRTAVILYIILRALTRSHYVK